MLGTRPHISWTFSKLSHFLEKPGIAHVNAIKHLMKYLKGTKSYQLVFTKTDEQLIGYVDADWGSDPIDRRSTTGHVFTLGSAPVSWKTQKQPTVALSSCEAEYMALAEATKEALYLRSLLRSLEIFQPELTTVFTDNQGALTLSKNSAKHHSQQIETNRYTFHFIHEQSAVAYKHIPTCEYVADILTKSVGGLQHKRLMDKLQIEGAC